MSLDSIASTVEGDVKTVADKLGAIVKPNRIPARLLVSATGALSTAKADPAPVASQPVATPTPSAAAVAAGIISDKDLRQTAERFLDDVLALAEVLAIRTGHTTIGSAIDKARSVIGTLESLAGDSPADVTG